MRRQLIEESGPDELAVAVQRLDLDELSDIYDELPPEVVEAVLRAMDGQRRQRFDVVRTYPEDTAGGLMDVDAITVRPDVTLRMVLNYLARYRAERGATILLASHNMAEVERLCDRVIMMRRGVIVDHATPLELLERYGRTNLEEVFLDVARGRREAEVPA